jgi:hypothetical protein
MKKLVLFSCLLLVLATTGAAFAQTPARCTPSADTLAKYKKVAGTASLQWRGVNGFYPNPSPVFCVGQYGETVIQVILPYDTATGLPAPLPDRITFNSFRLDSIGQVPNGLTFQTDKVPDGQGRVTFTPANGNTPAVACATVYGTPTQATAASDSVILYVYATTSVQNGSSSIKYRVRVSNPGPGVNCVATGVDNVLNQSSLSLYPSPASSSTRLAYELNKMADVRVEMIDMAGRVVFANQSNGQQPGNHELNIAVNNLPNGIYTVKLAIGSELLTTKLVVASN